MHRLPCSILSLDISDFTGAHTSNVKGTLEKTRLDKDGNIIKKNSEKMGEDKEQRTFYLWQLPEGKRRTACTGKGKTIRKTVFGSFS